ncbi:hypothetical protein [Aliiglaciecola litoralis]|uniref:Uncharacterized protein n=1 Tax=Aliiglaciecola litoralis TaxID=582857 RepID=A0ABP3X6A2_9ALTE
MLTKLMFYISIFCAPLGLFTFFVTGGAYLPNPFNTWIAGIVIAITGFLFKLKSVSSDKALGFTGLFVNGGLIILSIVYIFYFVVPTQD